VLATTFLQLWDHRMTDIFNIQNTIGPTMLLQGFITTAWEQLLLDMGCQWPHPQYQLVFLARTIWDEVVMPIMWKTRNHLIQDNPNFTNALMHTQLGALVFTTQGPTIQTGTILGMFFSH
jgi:hypothetical protein